MKADTYVIFELAGTQYAVSSLEVQHIEMCEHVTPVPNTSAAVEGVIFSRGNVVPALNLRVRFGFPRVPRTPATRVVMVQHQQRVVGLIVDAAREFRAIPPDLIRPIDETVAGISENYLRGVATLNGKLVLLLDMGRVLNVADIARIGAASAAPAERAISHSMQAVESTH